LTRVGWPRSWAAAKGGGRRRGPAGGESRVEERPREASGSVQGRPGAGLGRPSWAGRQSTVSGLVAEEGV
jgi:hypothetical protein